MPRYEYNAVKLSSADLDCVELDKLGAEGWELVNVCTGNWFNVAFVAFFKREIQEP